MKAKKITKPELEGDTYLVAQAVNHNAELLEGALNRIKVLEKRLEKEKLTGKLLEIEEFNKSEEMTIEERAKVISLVRDAFDTWEEWEGDVNKEDDWSKEHKARDLAIEALEREPFKDAYIKQVVRERDIAIGQLNELGYSLGEKIRPNEKERDCEHCSKTYGTLGCCDCVSNKWVYSCKEGQREYILNKLRAEIEAQEKWLAEAGYNAYNVGIAFNAIRLAFDGIYVERS